MTEASTVPDYPRGVTFEQVWATLQEAAEWRKETEKLMKENAERQRQTDEQFKRTERQMKKTDKQIKETAKQLGGLHNRFGEMAEHLVAPGIKSRLNELGYSFDSETPGGFVISENNKIKAEIDLMLLNSDTIMAIEIKATVKMKHIEEHVRRLEILREYWRGHKDMRHVEGAIAGAIFDIPEKKAAIEAGLYVIVQSGDTMKIEVPDGFIPKKF